MAMGKAPIAIPFSPGWRMPRRGPEKEDAAQKRSGDITSYGELPAYRRPAPTGREEETGEP
ncbi:MAG TPA: hypothetical protein VIU38_10480 [Anaerolineales bacterium]